MPKRWLLMPLCALLAPALAAQTIVIRKVPRPPAQVAGAPAEGSLAPDGYAPSPEWLGQTRAPTPKTTAAFTVETFAQGLAGAFSFNFLPDGRIIVAERPGRIKIVNKDGTVSQPLEGLPDRKSVV